MALAPRFGGLADSEIVKQAMENLWPTRDPETNAIDNAALIAEVGRLMSFDPAAEIRKKAARMVRAAERPGKTPADGQLFIPGFEPRTWEPDRLVPDNDGKTTKNNDATPHFVSAALARQGENLRRQAEAFRFGQAEADAFAEWAAEQGLLERPSNEITKGNFVREKGFWRPEPAPDHDDGDDD
jgi:hypothetical protein